jgi:hypothetical protein
MWVDGKGNEVDHKGTFVELTIDQKPRAVHNKPANKSVPMYKMKAGELHAYALTVGVDPLVAQHVAPAAAARPAKYKAMRVLRDEIREKLAKNAAAMVMQQPHGGGGGSSSSSSSSSSSKAAATSAAAAAARRTSSLPPGLSINELRTLAQSERVPLPDGAEGELLSVADIRAAIEAKRATIEDIMANEVQPGMENCLEQQLWLQRGGDESLYQVPCLLSLLLALTGCRIRSIIAHAFILMKLALSLSSNAPVAAGHGAHHG